MHTCCLILHCVRRKLRQCGVLSWKFATSNTILSLTDWHLQPVIDRQRLPMPVRSAYTYVYAYACATSCPPPAAPPPAAGAMTTGSSAGASCPVRPAGVMT